MNKKVKVVLKILLVIAIIALVMLVPKIIWRIDVNTIKNEVKDILDNIGSDVDYSKIRDDISKNKTSSERLDVEKKIEEYLLKVVEIDEKNNYNSKIIKDINSNLSMYSDASVIDNINKSIDELNRLREEFNSIYEENKDFEFVSNIKMTNLYRELVLDIYTSKLINNLDSTLKYNKSLLEIIAYLKDNSDYFDIDEKIVFKKRKKMEEYQELLEKLEFDNDTFKASIIDDKTSPVITVNNITINKGSNIDVKSYVKCEDDVDYDISLDVTGSIDTSKAGKYTVSVSCEDKSGNKATKDMTITVKDNTSSNYVNDGIRKVNSNPYYIEIIRNQNVTIVYGKDANGEYNNIVKVFTVSTGRNNWTPTGVFSTMKGYEWGALFGGVYGQYSTRIVGNILFHSVPYYSKNKADLEWEEYNKLGSAASLGCVRMTVNDVKWIYDNIVDGTTVKIYDGELPNGVVKPSTIKINADNPNRGWDPTDPDPANPWNA